MHTDLHQAPTIVPAPPSGAGERARPRAAGQSSRSPDNPKERFPRESPVRLPSNPDLLYPLAVVAVALVVAGVLWRIRARRARRLARRRAAGYQLIDCLKAYTSWIDWHRDEAMLQQNPRDSALPAALAQAVQIKDAHFPELTELMQQLLQTHRELMQYLWEENALRSANVAPLRAHYADPRYHNLRDRQDAALDSLFMRCRQSIGDSGQEWQRTRSDFSFSGDASGVSSQPPA